MDLALNSLQVLMCHKTQTTNNQPTYFSCCLFEDISLFGAMKRYSVFPKAPALLKFHHQIV